MGPKSETFNFEEVKPILNNIVVSTPYQSKVFGMFSEGSWRMKIVCQEYVKHLTST